MPCCMKIGCMYTGCTYTGCTNTGCMYTGCMYIGPAKDHKTSVSLVPTQMRANHKTSHEADTIREAELVLDAAKLAVALAFAMQSLPSLPIVPALKAFRGVQEPQATRLST